MQLFPISGDEHQRALKKEANCGKYTQDRQYGCEETTAQDLDRPALVLKNKGLLCNEIDCHGQSAFRSVPLDFSPIAGARYDGDVPSIDRRLDRR